VSFVPIASIVSAVCFVLAITAGAAAQPAAPECSTSQQCREMTLAAIAEDDFERAHDLAWRLFQTSRGNPEAMALLARAQSLSGRGDDAFIMLERLLAAGGSVVDVETSEDFRRVREHPRWSQLIAAMETSGAGDAGAAGLAGAGGTGGKRAAGASVAGLPAAPGAPGAPAAPSAPAAPLPPVPPVSPVSPAVAAPVPPAGLALPSALPAPGVFAYDAVSARFILADAVTDALSVVSEHSGSATTLVSAGWSGQSAITTVALNRRNGDMWVAARGETSSTLHRFQLVSGRQLQTIAAPDDAGPARFAAIALIVDTVFVLDTEGRRIFVLAPGNKTLRDFAVLPDTITPIGLAHAGVSLLVSHAAGLLRVDLSSRTSQPVSTGKTVDASDLHSLAWHNGSLLAIQRHSGGSHVVRLRFNARGTTVTAIDRLESASTTAGALAGDEYYFLGPQDGGLSFQSVPARDPSSGRSPPN
jgi:hypothetical protein